MHHSYTKRSLTTLVLMASMLVWGVQVSPSFALPTTCPGNLMVGDEVKVPGKPAIYVLDGSLKPRYFFSGYVYKSFKSNYGGYKSVTQECLLGLGSPNTAPFGITYRPGSYVVKRSGESQLYAVLPGNSLAKITDSTARVLHGSNYSVRTLDDREWIDYTCKKGDVSSNKVYPGMTFKVSSDTSKVWYVDNSSRLREVANNALSTNYILPEFTPTVPPSAIDGYSKGDMISGGITELTDRTQSGLGCGNNPPPQPPPPSDDKTAPTVSITSPATGVTVSGMMTFSANAEDNHQNASGVSYVKFFVDNQEVGTDNSAPYSISWDTKAKANMAIISLSVQAIDKTGNASAVVGGVAVKVDNSVVVPPPGDVGTLKVELYESLSGAPPGERLVTIGQNDYAPLFGVVLTAEKEPIQITNLVLKVAGAKFTSKDISNVRIYRNATDLDLTPKDPPLAILKETGCIIEGGTQCTYSVENFGNFPIIQPNSPMYLLVKADIGQPGKARVGDDMHFSMTSVDISAQGQNSQKNIVNIPFFNLVAKSTYITPWEVRISAANPQYGKTVDQSPVDGAILGTFLIRNVGPKSVYVSNLKFTDALNNHKGTPAYKLYYSDDPNIPKKHEVNASISGLEFKNLNFGIGLGIGPDEIKWVTVVVDSLNGAGWGDQWKLTMPNYGDAQYSVYESDLGYDNNGDGNTTGKVTGVIISGKPEAGTTRLNF